MNVISIDPSKSKTGVFTRIDKVESSFVITNKAKTTHSEALIKIYSEFSRILDSGVYDFGIIENPKHSSFSVYIFEIVGIIKLAFAQHGIPLIPVYVMTWKTLTMKDISKKESTKEYLKIVKKKYDREFKNTDEADAFLIYQAVKQIAKKTNRLTKGMQKIKDQLSKIIEDYKNGK